MPLAGWIVLALLIAFAMAAGVVRTTIPPLARGLGRNRGATGAAGMAPLQKSALAWLAIGLVMSLAYAVVQLAYGPAVVNATPALRLPLTGVLLVGLLAYAWLLRAARFRIRSGRVMLDERDEAILARAPRAQVAALLVGLAAWTIGLSEAFHEVGQIPVAFVFPLFWSLLLLALLALPIGILAGYWGE